MAVFDILVSYLAEIQYFFIKVGSTAVVEPMEMSGTEPWFEFRSWTLVQPSWFQRPFILF